MHTCSHSLKHNPILCIVPPHMLDKISENGTPDQKAFADATVATTQALMAERQAVARGEVPSAPKSMEPAVGAKKRYVYTAANQRTLPGTLVRQEGDAPSGDVTVNEAYDGAGATYDFYQSKYQRNSIDNQGMTLISTVHYDQNYDNAFWNGHQMVYGDGDQQIFTRFTIAIDVIGHELTHGVTQSEANLAYVNQSGALNESVSDVFGIMVKQFSLNQTSRAADWIIGAGLFMPSIHGVGIRSMKAPGTAYDDPTLGKDPQPGHMNNYVNTNQDNGGVHINSGIPNHAFYLIAYELNGYAWEKAGLVWYKTLTDKRLVNSASFQDFANLTYAIAGTQYGANSLEQQAFQKGWSGVGINVASVPTPTPSDGGCLKSLINIFSPSK